MKLSYTFSDNNQTMYETDVVTYTYINQEYQLCYHPQDSNLGMLGFSLLMNEISPPEAFHKTLEVNSFCFFSFYLFCCFLYIF